MAQRLLDSFHSSGSSASGGQAEWQDMEPDVEENEFTSLFDKEKFKDVNAMLQYCKDKYHFDFVLVQSKLRT
jgi:hypothetical protein